MVDGSSHANNISESIAEIAFRPILESTCHFIQVPTAEISFFNSPNSKLVMSSKSKSMISTELDVMDRQLLDGEYMIIENLLLHAKFSPAVKNDEKNRVFYSSFPVIVQNHVAGSIVVYDSMTRRIKSHQIKLLLIFAKAVATQLELQILAEENQLKSKKIS